jgi:hypothetical protein
LLHLKLHVIKNAVEVDWIEFDGHLNSWVLLEMDERSLSLLWVQHACGPLNPFSFFHCDLFAVKYHQLNKALDYNHSVVLLARNRIVNQGQIKQIRQISKFFNLKQLLDAIVRDVE